MEYLYVMRTLGGTTWQVPISTSIRQKSNLSLRLLTYLKTSAPNRTRLNASVVECAECLDPNANIKKGGAN